MADVNVELDVMIIEAGILANSVTPTDAGKALQAKIQEAAEAAWNDRKPDVVLTFNPFEAGMLLGGLSRSGGNVTGDLINRTFTAVNAKMEELGIQPLNNPSPSLDSGSGAPAAGLDPNQLDQGGENQQPAPENGTDEQPAACDASDTQPEQQAG